MSTRSQAQRDEHTRTDRPAARPARQRAGRSQGAGGTGSAGPTPAARRRTAERAGTSPAATRRSPAEASATMPAETPAKGPARGPAGKSGKQASRGQGSGSKSARGSAKRAASTASRNAAAPPHPAGPPARTPVRTPPREPVATPRTRRPAASRGRPPRGPFVLLVLGLLGGALVSLLLLNTILAQRSFTLESLQERNSHLTQRVEALEQEVAYQSSSEVLARKARALGMVPTRTPAFLDPDAGTIRGVTASTSGAQRDAGQDAEEDAGQDAGEEAGR